jgi:hypothetical protein
MTREIDRALAKVTGAAVRAADELGNVRNTARALPLPIRIQLNNAIEELDLLRFRLHEATLMRVISASDSPG